MNKIIVDSHNGWTRKWGAGQWRGMPARSTSLVFSDNQTLITSGWDDVYSIRLPALKEQTLVDREEGEISPSAIAISPDRTSIAVAGWDFESKKESSIVIKSPR